MEYVTLNNGVKMPKLGLGVMGMTDEKMAEDIIVEALNLGYRLIDTAAAYGNEHIVGNAIKRSGIDREELFITSKLWVSNMSYEGAKKGLEESLEKLGLDYIDLYILHQPIGDIYGAWRYLEQAYKEGKVRAIGVDNFNQAKLVEFIKFNEVKPAVNMIEANIFSQRKDDHKAMQKRGVQMEAWAPFASGSNNVFELFELKNIAKKYNKSVAQVILRWFMQRDIVAIPKSTNVNRLKDNLNIFDFTLTEEDMAVIAALDSKKGFSLPEDADNFERILNMWEKMFG